MRQHQRQRGEGDTAVPKKNERVAGVVVAVVSAGKGTGKALAVMWRRVGRVLEISAAAGASTRLQGSAGR